MPTRGTTAANRLRRVDRWLIGSPRVRAALDSAEEPLVVDLGYGALPVTTTELAARLRAVAPGVQVVGLEIDAERVAGMTLTESCAMLPAASVSGLYFAHPESRYFAVDRITREQVEAYAARKGMPVSEIERWLAPNLGYDA